MGLFLKNKSFGYCIPVINILRGPAQYDNAEHTTFTNTYKPLSNKGYIVGARTGQREYYQINVSSFFILE